MSEVNYTPQQQNAIDARDTSVIVSAAAGSGKTAVLTERLADILADPTANVKADRIIVVTFATDAAAEMKSRLDSKLTKLINEYPDNKYLLEQQVLLQNAKISTINSFCFDLLRDNISEYDITSGFSVLSESDEKVIKSQAMDELFDFYSHEDYETISALYDWFCFRDRKNLVEIIRKTDEFLESVDVDERWLDKAVAEYKKDFTDSVYYNPLFEYISREAQVFLSKFEKNALKISNIFERTEDAENHLIQVEMDKSRIRKLINSAEKKHLPDSEEIKEFAIMDKIVPVKKNAVYDKDLRKTYGDCRNDLKKNYNAFLNGLAMVYDNFEETGKVAELLVKVVRKYREIIMEKKFSKNALSFADGERLALNLLIDYDENGNIIPSETARNIAESYDIIMIDEYQDSSNRQDLIFKLISHNYKLDENGNPLYGDNVFLVGDVKQSIYRFRLANPKNFISTMKNSVPYYSKSDAKNQAIFLNMNFRSSPEVIDFINFVFSEIMSEKCGEIDYNDDEKLYFGAKQYIKPHGDNRLTHFMLIDTDNEVSDDNYGETVKNLEAEATAEKIAEMLTEGVPVIDSDGNSSVCRPSDFCILVRDNYCMKDYINALADRNISAKGSDEKGYLKSQEIVILLDLLRIIANPLQDVPIATVMLSPMYTFTIENLAYIKSFDRKKLIYQILIEAADNTIPDFDAELAEKCRDFLKSIEKFRLNAVTMTTGELINSIYDTTDFISVMQIHKDGDKKRANLRMLIQYAQDYESFAAADGRGGLTGFLRHIDRISKEGSDYQQGKSSASSGDYVRIMTFHKSKGLEYPFVFICETDSTFKTNKIDKSNIMFNDDGRIGCILFNKEIMKRYKTFQYKMMHSEAVANLLSEEMRLLYVGMTRAKQRLFINLRCGTKQVERVQELVNECILNGSEIKNSVAKAKKFSDWLWLCLMMHSDFPAIAELVGIDTEDCGFPAYDVSERLFDYEFIAGTDTDKKFSDRKFIKAEANDEIVAGIQDIVNTNYDRTLSETSAKLSVTQISKKFSEAEEFDFHLQRPKFISEIRKMTGAERGTAIHTFFQYCDFDKAIADVTAETERLVGLGFLTKAQAQCVVPAKVTAFFESELYRRIRSAKNYERERKFTVTSSHLKANNPELEKLKDSDNMIKGIVDIMFEENDGLVVIDYKSDRGISADGLRKRYEKQLQIYKSAVELITGKKVKELVIYSIELEKTIIL